MQAKIIERQKYKEEARETKKKLEKIKHLLDEAVKFS